MNHLARQLLQPRILNLLALTLTVVAMAGALVLQHWGGMEPCPLCIFQRMAVLATGAVLLVAVLHNPGLTGRRIYGGLTVLAAGTGIGIAIRHLWLQSLPPHALPACGPDMSYMLETFPLQETLAMVFAGTGDCADVETFLLISVPGWTLIVSGMLAMVGLVQVFRRAG